MTYIFTRHAEKPIPRLIDKDRAEWIIARDYGSDYGLKKLRTLIDGEIDHISVRDGKITVEKTK